MCVLLFVLSLGLFVIEVLVFVFVVFGCNLLFGYMGLLLFG